VHLLLTLQNTQRNYVAYLLASFNSHNQFVHKGKFSVHIYRKAVAELSAPLFDFLLSQNSVGEPLETWAYTTLFSKIGMTNYSWLKYDGYNFGGYGISATPRELTKIGQLVLNKGNCNGLQVVDSLWIEQMTTTQTDAGSSISFGNLWWIDESSGAYFMAGSGGQYAVIIPDKNLLIASMAEHDTDRDFETFWKIVGRIRVTAN